MSYRADEQPWHHMPMFDVTIVPTKLSDSLVICCFLEKRGIFHIAPSFWKRSIAAFSAGQGGVYDGSIGGSGHHNENVGVDRNQPGASIRS